MIRKGENKEKLLTIFEIYICYLPILFVDYISFVSCVEMNALLQFEMLA
jgi:hypothetical protein